jgi:signal transduction histidine kinase
MQLTLLPFLKSRWRFTIALTIVILLLVAGLGALQMEMLVRINGYEKTARETDRQEFCMAGLFAATDYACDVFAVHVDALDNMRLGSLSSDSIQAVLRKFASLPGVRGAYCLKNGVTLLSSAQAAPASLAGYLADSRTTFETYPVGAKHYYRKIAARLVNRARFVDAPLQGDTLRMILSGYDREGKVIHFLPEAATDPALIAYVIALDMDPQWMRQAVANRLEEVFYSRLSFVLWSPPPMDSTTEYLDGLGATFLGDTIWWKGLKSVDVGSVYPGGGGRAMPWLKFTALYREDPEELKSWAAYHRQLYVMLIIVDVAAAGLALLLVWGLVLVRKQWLARQTALTHLAHAIRTPAARLRLDVDTLREKRAISPEEERDVVRSIGNECSRIERAVQNAALSLNGNGHTVERTAGDLSQIVGNGLRQWESTFHSAGVTLKMPSSMQPLPGQFDAEMIVTLLDNLLDNALRHTRIQQQKNPGRPQTVAVGLQEANRVAVLTVDDSDGGVPVADRQRIFKRFERGSDPALTGASGLGLGLALVKEIAEAHGGNVTVSDSDLGGARFTVHLPLSETAIHSRR